SDMIVKASIRKLKEIADISCCMDCSPYLKRQFIDEEFLNDKDQKKSFQMLKQEYSLKEIPFNSGLIAFDTKIIKNNSLEEIMKLYHSYKEIIKYPEQAILNLYFYKKWTSLPLAYNTYSVISLDKKIDVVIIHSAGDRKAWSKLSEFKKEWKKNLEKFEITDFPNPIDNYRTIPEKDIKKISKEIEKRIFIESAKMRKKPTLGYRIDREVGLIGKFMQKKTPSIYRFLKYIEKNVKFSKDKIIIFGHPRSGSNSLVDILCLNPHIKIFSEPFNPEVLSIVRPELIPRLQEIKNVSDVENFLKEIYSNYNGIKTFTQNMSVNINKYLLLNPKNKIVFLTRNNLLKFAVSYEISLKTNIWRADKNDPLKIDKVLEKISEDIPIKNLEKNIKEIKNHIKFYKNLLKENQKEYFELFYEDLFEEDIPFEKKLEKINELFKFLGYSEIKECEEIREILNPNYRKINSNKTYRLIPNIEEIEKNLGNKENGYLFKD
ncbi:MAG: glycosyltransferase, partial [Candidatus Nanoarchaeia archaeon]|nr:glycosyltransferase [Candidatus Nanoarchaeia archaeon]